MALRSLIAVSLGVLVFAACQSKPPTVGEPMDFNAVCNGGNQGKRVAAEGYLRLPNVIDNKVYTQLDLYKTKDFNTLPIGVAIDFGTQPNQVELAPKKYTDTDLKVHLANGQVAGFGTKVKVSGDVYVPSMAPGGTCALKNPLVEAAE